MIGAVIKEAAKPRRGYAASSLSHAQWRMRSDDCHRGVGFKRNA